MAAVPRGKKRKRNAPKMAIPSKESTRTVWETCAIHSWALPRAHLQMIALWGTMVSNEEEEARTNAIWTVNRYYACTKWWDRGKFVLHVIFLTAFVVSIIQSHPKVGLNISDKVIQLANLWSPQNFRPHLASGQTCVPDLPSFANRMNWALRTLPNVVLCFSPTLLWPTLPCLNPLPADSQRAPRTEPQRSSSLTTTDWRSPRWSGFLHGLDPYLNGGFQWGSSLPASASGHNQ